jgi:hypothetical protein
MSLVQTEEIRLGASCISTSHPTDQGISGSARGARLQAEGEALVHGKAIGSNYHECEWLYFETKDPGWYWRNEAGVSIPSFSLLCRR